MQDCRLTIDVKDNAVTIRAENIGIGEASVLYGLYGRYIGMHAVRLGSTLDQVKNTLLDIHLAAMQLLTEQLIKEGRDPDGGEDETETDDAEGDPGSGRI